LSSRAIGAVLHPVTAALERVALAPHGVILVAVSGGADSVAMLHALAALRTRSGFTLIAAHLNHRLRGPEADRDENFVRELCAKLDVALMVERTSSLTVTTSNLEERARETRHAFLNRLAERHRAGLIALAHQADDQAETVLMRLLRGAGAAGLAAMGEKGPGRLWRPLLTVKRTAIIAYLGAIGTTWITDSSNVSRAVLRNRIRLDLLPLLERDFAPGVAGRLTELAGQMRALDEYVSNAAHAELAQRLKGGQLALEGFSRLHPALAHAVIRESVRERLGDLRRISRDHIGMMLELCQGMNPSGCVILPGGWRLRRKYGLARFEHTKERCVEPARPGLIKLKERGMTRVAQCDVTFHSRLSERSARRPIAPPRDATEAIFDADQLREVLAVRAVHPGDRLEPHGLAGSRKVQDLFVDRKVPRPLRAAWPLVVAGEKILWIPGIARSRTALVTASSINVRHLQAFPLTRIEGTSLLENPPT
jgi:tRNA(Ile)-lysidine synthase